MDIFIRAIAGVLVAVLLCLSPSQKGKEISILLALLVCVMVVTAGFTYLRPVPSFFSRLEDLIGLNNGLTLQLLAGEDTISACGTWSCPDFFEAFMEAAK